MVSPMILKSQHVLFVVILKDSMVADACECEAEPGWELLPRPDASSAIKTDAAGQTVSQQILPASVVSKFARLLQLQHRGTALLKG